MAEIFQEGNKGRKPARTNRLAKQINIRDFCNKRVKTQRQAGLTGFSCCQRQH